MPLGPELQYLAGYPDAVRDRVRGLLETGQLETTLVQRYPGAPEVTNDRTLYEYVLGLKNTFLRRAPPLAKIMFDDKISAKQGFLGLHTYVSRVQGSRNKAKNELRIASLFKGTPPEFLRMVVVHELAHLKEREHNKAFYQLCCHMEPDYHQFEFDLRLYLTVQDARDAAVPDFTLERGS